MTMMKWRLRRQLKRAGRAPNGKPSKCLLCEFRSEFQVSANATEGDTEVVYLCDDDLGPFLRTWAHPHVASWIVTKIR